MYYWQHFYHYTSRSKKRVVRKAVEISFMIAKLFPFFSKPSFGYNIFNNNYEFDVVLFGVNFWVAIQTRNERELTK